MIAEVFTKIIAAAGVVDLLLIAGVSIGATLIGMLPGLGPISAFALLIPVTYSLGPAVGLLALACAYHGALFGGWFTAILINAPGTPGTVATAMEGYPMAQQGKVGKALLIAAVTGFFGFVVAILILTSAISELTKITRLFHSADYFMLTVLGLTAVASFSGKRNTVRGMISTVLGLMLSLVGVDLNSGVSRFTFGSSALVEGVSFILVAMGVFSLAQAVGNIMKKPTSKLNVEGMKKASKMGITKDEAGDMAVSSVRASLLGMLTGMVPGTGATVSSFVAYSMERSLAPLKKSEEFGKGSVRGLAAVQAAGNAARASSLLPMLTLGIPSSSLLALLLGALISHGVQPGPRLYSATPESFWLVIIAMLLGGLIILCLCLPLIPCFVRMLLVPRHFLLPTIFFLALSGVYVSGDIFHVLLLLVIALVATLLQLVAYPMAPFLLGFVLGVTMEDNLRRALLLGDGSWSFLWERPTTLAILIATMALVLLQILTHMLRK